MRRFLIGVAALLTVIPAGMVAATASPAVTTPVPPDFAAQSQDWTSATNGFVLGTATCNNGSTCTIVVRTTDGGATWSKLGKIPAAIGLDVRSEVYFVRFADSSHGWAFGPSLYATTDGGKTWTKETIPGSGKGHYVMSLAASTDAVYLAVSGCKYEGANCTKPASLWKTTPSDGTWHAVSLTLPASRFATLAIHGQVAYLIVPSAFDGPSGPGIPPDLLFATTDGSAWNARPVPCDKNMDETLVAVAPWSDTNVGLLCIGDPGVGNSTKRVFRSKDTGMTTSSAGTAPRPGITATLAAAPNGTLVLPTSSNPGSWIYLNTGGKTWTTPVSLNDFGEGWLDPIFTSNKVGYVVYSPVGYPLGGLGQLWQTTDGGVTWSAIPFTG